MTRQLAPHISLWQKKWAQDLPPLATSIAVCGVFIMIVIASARNASVMGQVVQEDVIVHDSEAKKIAYVCDASGSMMGNLLRLKREVELSIEKLEPTQAFNLFFFAQGTAVALDDVRLLVANPDNKQKAYDFLKTVTTRANTDPIPALEMAFHQKSELIYFLTDGDFPDLRAVEVAIDKLNPEKSVKINTIHFVDLKSKREHPDAHNDIETLLKKITSESGGVYKTVTYERRE